MNKFLEQFNFKKAAQELGVSVWQTPNVLFLMMGLVIAIIMFILYFFSKDYGDPRVLVVSECLTAITLLSVGSSIINRIVDIARLNRLKTRFLELASNRLKDPLATMRWELEVLLERTEGELNLKQKKIVDSIVESNESMINLVKDLLDIARIEDVETIHGEDLINLDALIRTIIYENKNYADSKKIKIEYKNEAGGYHVQSSKKLIKIALENLISNAIRFSRENGNVAVNMSGGGDFVGIKVVDQGYGIPESEKEYIFSKFFRASNILAHNIEGTGLGLYVVKKVVTGAKGKVWFTSKEGEGSVFSVELPIYNQDQK